MAHIIVIGAGLGGIPAAFDLRRHLGKNHRVTLIGERPYFEFTPSNPWIAVGWRTSKETQVQMQKPLHNKGVEWRINTVMKIEAESSTLTLNDARQLRYMGLGGVAVAIPPVEATPATTGAPKTGYMFAKYVMRKVRTGSLTPVYETMS